jgi:hypothetical protein
MPSFLIKFPCSKAYHKVVNFLPQFIGTINLLNSERYKCIIYAIVIVTVCGMASHKAFCTLLLLLNYYVSLSQY